MFIFVGMHEMNIQEGMPLALELFLAFAEETEDTTKNNNPKRGECHHEYDKRIALVLARRWSSKAADRGHDAHASL